MRTVNVVIFLLAIAALIWTIRSFSQNRTGIRSTVVWMGLWTAIGLFGLFPDLIEILMSTTMMRNRMFFVFVVSILMLYAMFFRETAENFELRRKVNRIAQEVAFLRHELEYRSAGRPDENRDADQ